MNQRATGMNRTVLVNEDTGRHEVVYESRKTSVQFWMSLIVQFLAIGAVVFAAARMGLVVETRSVIEEELEPPTGIIFNGIHSCVDDHIKPIAEDITELDKNLAIQTTVQAEIRTDIGEIKDAVKEIQRNGGT